MGSLAQLGGQITRAISSLGTQAIDEKVLDGELRAVQHINELPCVRGQATLEWVHAADAGAHSHTMLGNLPQAALRRSARRYFKLM